MTDFQPQLPAEVPLSDAELAFMDESPGQLFPENQNSNFGYIIRKIFSDRVQEAIRQLDTIYAEKFVATSTQYLDEWEKMVGLPVNTGQWTTAQRRNLILNRLRKGAFTHAARAAVVESFVTSTFGVSPAFGTDGIALVGAGIPLYSGITNIVGSYAIRENYTWRNLVDNPSAEVDAAGMSNYANATVSRDTGSPLGTKYGTCAFLIARAAGTDYTVVMRRRDGSRFSTPLPAGYPYAWSFWATNGSGGGNVQGQIRWFDVGGTFLGNSTGTVVPLTSTPQRITCIGNLPLNAVSAELIIAITGSAGAGSYVRVDGLQFEQSATVNDWSDPAGQNYYYEVRILNSISPDLTGLTRELTRITPAGISFSITSTSTP